MHKKSLLQLALALFCFTVVQTEAQTQITTFEECVAAGFPVQKMLPPRCTTSDGKSFVQGSAAGANSKKACKDLCGDGTCQSIVCLGLDCPCAETHAICPADCGVDE